MFCKNGLVGLGQSPNTDVCSVHSSVGIPKELAAMTADLDINEPMHWIEDLGGLGFDELRDLPFAVQASMDIAVFE